ncbi:hypothetical protein RSOLAG1IB_08908 [Rhizoctonia solani AG-1 IB]|uniref:Uncharacterized protein n=1 Tax=Thanatephorus cucumeris (strain AG1-IB / isolate 7/3/14) TaxID=1108050 RepID=A0A0B7FRR8_THACB|nr:hypothetical protein RSOLAG1IB_08908 [Rhizoctonia solani AG-1 IB]
MMARLTTFTLRVTVLYLILKATRMSTPSHSDVSIRVTEDLPPVYPILTISSPPPANSQRIKGPVCPRGHLRVQKLVTPYALRASWYVNQVMEILGRPSLDNLAGLVVLPTTGKIPSPPPSWVHFEPIIVVKPRSTPPTNATPVSTLLTRTRGHHSLPAPKVARHRAGSAGSVSRAWSKFQIEKVICIASAFVLIVMSLVRRFANALPSVNSIKHQGLENDDAVFLPPKFEANFAQNAQEPKINAVNINQYCRPVSSHLGPPTYSQILAPVKHVPLLVVRYSTQRNNPNNRLKTIQPQPPLPLDTLLAREFALVRYVPTVIILPITSRIPFRVAVRNTLYPIPVRPRPCIKQHATRLLIEWYALPQATQTLEGRTKTREPEPPRSDSTTLAQSPFKISIPPYIPASFHRYGKFRLEELSTYHPDEQQRVLCREIKLAEARYRYEKPRRDRLRFDLQWIRSKINKRAGQKLRRRKTREEIEDEKDMKQVMAARQRGEEEVYEGLGGPEPQPPEWVLVALETIRRDTMPDRVWGTKKKDGRKGILKSSRKFKGRQKSVRWVDEIGRKLAG